MTDAPCAPGGRSSLKARFSGAALAWDTVEAAGRGRSTELTSRYEANGVLTAARDAIVLNLIREGGNRTGEAIVGLVFRRTRKDRLERQQRNPSGDLGTRWSTRLGSCTSCRRPSSRSGPQRGTLPRCTAHRGGRTVRRARP